MVLEIALTNFFSLNEKVILDMQAANIQTKEVRALDDLLMTQITLTITDPKDASLIKKLLAKFDSVTISKPARRRKTGIDEALEDVKAGRVYHCDSVEDFLKEMGGMNKKVVTRQIILTRYTIATLSRHDKPEI